MQPFPKNVTDEQREKIERAAQVVLDARAQFPEATLADLYDPDAMPPELLKAHRDLDVAVGVLRAKIQNGLGKIRIFV